MCGCRELQTGESHFCAWEYHGMDPHGSDVKAQVRQGDDSRQSAWLYLGPVVPDQSGGLLWLTLSTRETD